MSEERWLPIPGYEGRYEVSSLGRVRSLAHGPRLLYPRRAARGKDHLCVLLYDGTGYSGRKAFLVHRLVLSAFVGPAPFEKARALHRNDVADDNRVEDLYWGSDSDNPLDRHRIRGGHSEETRRRISESTKGRVPWNKGRGGEGNL